VQGRLGTAGQGGGHTHVSSLHSLRAQHLRCPLPRSQTTTLITLAQPSPPPQGADPHGVGLPSLRPAHLPDHRGLAHRLLPTAAVHQPQERDGAEGGIQVGGAVCVRLLRALLMCGRAVVHYGQSVIKGASSNPPTAIRLLDPASDPPTSKP